MAKTASKKKRWFGLQGHLGALFAVFMALTGLVLSVIGYIVIVNVSHSEMRETVDDLTRIIRNGIVHMVREPVQPTLSALARSKLSEQRTLEERLTHLPILVSLLNNYEVISGIRAGHDNGDYFMVRHMTAEDEKQHYDAPPESAVMVVNISGGVHETLFFDDELRLIHRRSPIVGKGFDPRKEIWFKAAMQTDGQLEFSPYSTLSRLPVMLFVEKSRDGRAVIGVDATILHISEILRNELPTPNSHLALLHPDGTLIASSQGMLAENGNAFRTRTLEDLPPILNQTVKAYLAGQRGRAIAFDDGERKWQVSLEEFRFNHEVKDVMLLAIPQEDLLAKGMDFLRYALLGMAGVLLFSLPLGWLAARRISLPLRAIGRKMRNPAELNDEEGKAKSSHVREIDELMHGIDHMQQHQKRILSLISMIGSDRNIQGVLEHALKDIVSMVRADGGVLVTVDRTRNVLDKGWFCWDGGEVRLVDMSVDTLIQSIPKERYSTYRAMGENRNILDSVTRDDPRAQIAPLIPGFNDASVERLDLISVPLCDRMGEPLGSITLHRRFHFGGTGKTAFPLGQVAFIETLAATTAIVLETQELIKGQLDLRDALIHIIAGAIDAKSPYTGGHCARVPVIFQMLLEAASKEQEGLFKDFTLDEDGWEEARLAGWLHDCGKVTTPEYVMDKATKLETLYDRIHEIRTRFEVLKRDAQNTYLRALLDDADPASARQKLEKELQSLDEDFAFVASCNTGSEYMDDDALVRLSAISERNWLRTLDKRLGVSRDELARMNGTCTPALEKLLMDSSEHIIPRGEKDRLDLQDSGGFRLTPPEALYNRGELYNLSIQRGTLTEEERYKINDHITRTIVMLEAMPLPKHLRNVPEIAGAHHETMDGRGYPRGLTRDEMSWPARMMAVADIFEALTAWDRPYKSSKTLKETLAIMEGFKKRNHIDPDVYELFIRSGVPQRYAKEYLKPEQNDL